MLVVATLRGDLAMYVSFNVENFRTFKSLHFADIARVNLISGENNTGKTTLLEAILFHLRDFRTALTNMRGDQNAQSLFFELDVNSVIRISGDYRRVAAQQSLFPDNSWGFEIKLVDEVSLDLQERISQEIRLIGLRSPNRREQIDLTDDDSVLRVTPLNDSIESVFYIVEFNNRLRVINGRSHTHEVQSAFLTSRERILPRVNARRLSKLSLNNAANSFVETLQVIDPRIRTARVEAPNGEPLIFVDVGLRQYIPLSLMGDGIDRVASILLAMAEAQGGVILIDEVENGLHYSRLEKVWEAIHAAALEFNVQIFATTHSYECIKAAHEVFNQSEQYDFRYHRLDRHKQSGEITIKTFPADGLELAIELNYEVR